MNNSIAFILLALAAGAMIPFQTAMNAQLGKALQSPWHSALNLTRPGYIFNHFFCQPKRQGHTGTAHAV